MRLRLTALPFATVACPATAGPPAQDRAATSTGSGPRSTDGGRCLAQPLVSDIDAADPAAHVFAGGLHPAAIDVEDIPWAAKQAWAPDAAYRDGTCDLYMPARDRREVFRIGVATSRSPTGPFRAEAEPIRGSVSIDPAVFAASDGEQDMHLGGIRGGQPQRRAGGRHDADMGDTDLKRDDRPALSPKVARMTADTKRFAEPPRDIVILGAAGAIRPIPPFRN